MDPPEALKKRSEQQIVIPKACICTVFPVQFSMFRRGVRRQTACLVHCIILQDFFSGCCPWGLHVARPLAQHASSKQGASKIQKPREERKENAGVLELVGKAFSAKAPVYIPDAVA